MSGPPTLQGKSSATWLCPPLDGSLTVPEIFEYHARNSPKHPLFVYPDNRTGSRTILYPEALRAFRRAAKIASGHYQAFREKHGRATASTIGILAVADSISYFSLMVGIMQLGLTAFPISTRNSAVGVAHLIRTTGVQQVFVSPDSAMQRLSQEAIDVLAKDGVSVELLPFPQFSDLYDGSSSDEPEVVPLDNLSKDATTLILHSSGSTAFPKSIKVSHLNFLQWGKALHYGEVDICGKVIAAHALPMFHGMGATVMTWAACSGAVMGCFPPSSPPVLPNPDNFLEAIVDTNSDLVSCVPAHVEAWSRSPANLPILQKLMGIVFGGAPLNKEIGDALSRAGVKLTPFYGATEIGNVILSVPDLENETVWEYFRFSPHLRVEILLQEDTTDIFEPVILSSPPYTPNVINTEINGILGYRTNDLVQRHPVRDDYYRIYGRLDDQLMLSTGEKTNPVPLETIMLQDPHIVAALMFGRGRFQNGVIIQPKDEFDPNDTEELAEFRKVIWPTIERVNEYAPSHSRVFKEMIIVTSPAKSFEYTPKGTPRRQVCIDAYSDEIDAAYTAVKTSSQTELEPPASWMPELISEFVRAAVRQVMKEPVRDEDDLFQHGCDSLQATSIRNTILRALRSSSRVSTHDIPSTFVYTHPSIRALSDFISGLFSKTGAAQGSPTTRESKTQEMRELVQKYSRNFVRAAHQPEMNGTGETILLTGTTGHLGCHLLAMLLRKPDVHRVFALNRGLSHVDLEERQRQAFATWALDLGLLSSPKLTLLVSDLAKERLGLDQEVYEHTQRSVTIIIHNAWRVDFNLSLSSFEPLIAGVRHLIDLALSSTCPGGARFIFTSSVAVLRNYSTAHPAPEEPISNPETSIGLGYSESKWVAEQLLVIAAKDASLRSTVVRVGQLSGDTQIGGWNTKEWFPALMAASKTLYCIPERDEKLVTWVPVDVAASVLVEMATGPYEPVLHLICSRSIPWNTLLKPIAKGLNLPLVPYSKWLSRLQAKVNTDHANASQSHRHNTTLSLREFFQSGYFGDSVPLDTARAVRVSSTLAGLQALDEESVWRSMQFWEKARLFSTGDQ